MPSKAPLKAQARAPIQPFPRPFPPELYRIILPYLQRPMPLPLSRPERNALRQPYLAVCMRICSYWRTIVEPLLYTHVVTDSLFTIGANYHMRTQGGQFDHTKSLRIEYADKLTDPAYTDVMQLGKKIWAYIGWDKEMAAKMSKEECEKELKDLTGGLQGLCRLSMAKVFPKLETLAVDSIYGNGDDIWKFYRWSWETDEEAHAYQGVTELFKLFMHSGNTLRSICTRDSEGPLTLAFLPPPDVGVTRSYTPTVHFSGHAEQLALCPGLKVRWVSDVDQSHDFAPVIRSLLASSDILRNHRMPARECQELGLPYPPLQ